MSSSDQPQASEPQKLHPELDESRDKYNLDRNIISNLQLKINLEKKEREEEEE